MARHAGKLAAPESIAKRSSGAGGRIASTFASRICLARSVISDASPGSQEECAVGVERRERSPFRNDCGYFHELLDDRFVSSRNCIAQPRFGPLPEGAHFLRGLAARCMFADGEAGAQRVLVIV